jgi:NADH dehydrogenase/NADH:ubiquinone oxidoreductase subunit G
MMSLKVKINNKTYNAEKGEYVLELCRQNQILIPTLCHHESLSGLGACRLCVVEVNEGGGNRVVVSCVYPLSRDCEIFTESEKIKGIRRTILSMLRGRAPEGNRLASLCSMYGVEDDGRFSPPKNEKGSSGEKRLTSACILCGLCVEACAKLGTGAISTVGRGTGRKISTPYDEPCADCVGCGSCAAVCPTAAIECAERDSIRTIWGKTFDLVCCEICGRPFATKEELKYSAKLSAPDDGAATPVGNVCENCRRRKSSDVMANAFGIRV